MSNIKDFLSQLDTINTDDSIDILVPSINKKVKFKSLSVKQHKEVIKTILEGIEGGVRSSGVLNNFVVDNCITEGIDFKLYDRNYILVQLRKNSIGENVTINKQSYSLDSLPVFKFDYPVSGEVIHKNLTVKLSIPSLSEDTKLNDKSLFEFSKLTTEDKKLKDSVNILLAFEIIKFVDVITIDAATITFKDLTIHERKTVVENLPLKLNLKIVDFISKYKEYEQRFFTFDDGSKLAIDASFLTSE